MILDPDGIFHGNRWLQCSNAAQLHALRLFLASNGFARIEVNYARLVGRAYATFKPIPTEEELMGYVRELADAHLLFLFESSGQLWGAWDTRPELLPRYKTAADKRSPEPPEPDFTQWKNAYRAETKRLPKFFEKIPRFSRSSSATFLHGGGVGKGVGEVIPLTPFSEISTEPTIAPDSRWAGRPRAELLDLLIEGSELYACAILDVRDFENHTDAEIAELLDELFQSFVSPLPVPTGRIPAELLAGAGALEATA
jgi:hypothetical protein